MKILTFLALICLLIGCGRPSYDDFREKGRAKTRSLILELRAIRTKDQLIEHQKELMLAFEELALLMGKVKLYQDAYPSEDSAPLTQRDREESENLRLEILRICRLEGGRQVILKATDIEGLREGLRKY